MKKFLSNKGDVALYSGMGCLIVLLILFATGVTWAIGATILWFGWNLIAPVFDGPLLSWWQAFGLFLVLGVVSMALSSRITVEKS